MAYTKAMEPGDGPDTDEVISSPLGHHYRLPLFIGIAVVAILLIGGAGYWLLVAHHTKAPQAATSTDTTGVQPTVPDDTTAENTTVQYVSNGQDLNLSFGYPSTWTVTPETNSNQSDQPITVTSPLVSIVNASNQSVTGRVVVSIRPGTATLSELASNNAIAGQASVQIAYSKPTSSQHQYPYLTFIHLAGGSDPSSGFEEVMITGVSSFAKDEAITSSSLSQLDPIISARFYACSDEQCAANDSAALSITNDGWQNNTVTAQALAIFQSLQIN